VYEQREAKVLVRILGQAPLATAVYWFTCWSGVEPGLPPVCPARFMKTA
jgi:hypothetical protein